MVKFYRDTLGLVPDGEMEFPNGAHMTRLLCGTTVIKLVVNGTAPKNKGIPGGADGAEGYRYWTVTVSNLEETVSKCRDAGYNIALGPNEIRPGVHFVIIEDPDGNWVELLQTA